MTHTWRDMARPIIQKVLIENQGKTEKEIRKALREVWPWGMRAHHPYRIWLDEIKVQMKKKTFGRGTVPVNRQQGTLF